MHALCLNGIKFEIEDYRTIFRLIIVEFVFVDEIFVVKVSNQSITILGLLEIGLDKFYRFLTGLYFFEIGYDTFYFIRNKNLISVRFIT